MIHVRLTELRAPATSQSVKVQGRFVARVVLLIAGAMASTGCITVESPDKPIVIELNINITQEVIYRLAADAENTIEENSDIF